MLLAASTGVFGLTIGIVGASAGAFFGVCSATAWTVGLSLPISYEKAIPIGMAAGLIVGGAIFFLVGIWLVWRLWPFKVRML